MPTTSNFGWATPADTDLVKDGALAIRTLGNGIDASMAELKGGTTGQVLSKTSNTDMDFTWVTSDDANAIQNAIVDAKGDLITATAADTPARLAVGNSGETLVADSSTTTGLRWGNNYGFTAGKNKILNADFRLNQRAFTSSTTTATYGFDRWRFTCDGGTVTYSAQTFTAGAAPVAGYEAINYARLVTSGQSAASDRALLNQLIEDVRTCAGQTVTVSFWAQAGSGTPKVNVVLNQNFGTGGSASVNAPIPTAQTISTSWARYSFTIDVPSVSGKTISATDSRLNVQLYVSDGGNQSTGVGAQNNTFNIWGVQVETGSVATAFQTATGTLAGELAACQRYYWTSDMSNAQIGTAYSATAAMFSISLPVSMRIAPTATYPTTLTGIINDLVNAQNRTPGALGTYVNRVDKVSFTATGLPAASLAAGYPVMINQSGFTWSAEL